MLTRDFDYSLPEELIAQRPAQPRDSSRLMVCGRQSGAPQHRIFREITDYLRPGDVLVLNNTRVMPARLYGIKEGGGAKAEFLLLKRLGIGEFEALVRPGKRLKPGDRVVFSPKLSAIITGGTDSGGRTVKFEYEGVFEDVLAGVGEMPLPHYIHEKPDDAERYQTVYSKVTGSAAAPTAGLHFTPELLEKIRALGVTVAEVLLHVGLGTFRPVKSESVEGHIMHSEYCEISGHAADAVNSAKREGRRVIAAGTTTVRTLESAADGDGIVTAGSRNTDIFITPGYRFKCVDGLLTNFHLPKSTLIMLVSAFAGRERTLELYRTAVNERYRFFSFGDAMLII